MVPAWCDELASSSFVGYVDFSQRILLISLRYNSVVYNTLAISNVGVLHVTPEFFTDKNSWDASDNGKAYKLNVSTKAFVAHMQASVLDGQYLNQSRFENVTGQDCIKRYSAMFASGGSAFAVVSPDEMRIVGARNGSFHGESVGNGELGIFPTTKCKFMRRGYSPTPARVFSRLFAALDLN